MKKRMTIKDWEIRENIISIKKEEDFKLRTQLEDALQTEEDSLKQERETDAIKDKFDRAYFTEAREDNNVKCLFITDKAYEIF